MEKVVNIIGGGYAGLEAALTLAKYGVSVHLFDAGVAEEQPLLVDKTLKDELAALQVSLLECLENGAKIREKVYKNIENLENLKFFPRKVGEISLSEPTIIATGGNTLQPLFSQIESVLGKVKCHHFQPQFPIVDGIENKVKCQNSNCVFPLSKEKVEGLVQAINYYRSDSQADGLEKWARSGREMLRAKALRPVVSDQVEYACVRLKKCDNGFIVQNFQTQLPENAQASIYRFLFGEECKLVRPAGAVACTYINPNLALNEYLQAQSNPNLFFAGRIVMADGQLEAIATGHFVALNMLNYLHGRKFVKLPKGILLGKLIDKLFSQPAFNLTQTSVSCDIIKNENKTEALKSLREFKEDYNARNAWYNDLCSKKRW